MATDTLFHVIKDPVHGTMQFTTLEDHWIKPFIDSPHFQRLRHIKQLGMGDFIFPGAVHTRFNHCLGCSYVACQIAHKIGLSEEERQLVMIAGLLHDIGHGPFSHTFEDLFVNKLIRHEDWTPFFLAEYNTETFFAHYNRINPRHHLTNEKFKQIEDMIMHTGHTKPLLADIVSSQLDADRLDYLLRDSHFCGVKYGEYDMKWMLHCMTIVNGEKGERLGITHKGIGVVEHYLMARRLMTRNIYHHQKKLALEFLLISLLKNVAENIATQPIYAKIKETRLGQFLMAAHEFNQSASHANDISLLKRNFLKKNYRTYKELYDYDIFSIITLLAQENTTDPAVVIAKRLVSRQMPKIIRLDHTNIKHIEKALHEFKQANRNAFQDWQMALIKNPHQAYSLEDAILVTTDQSIQPLNELSVMINAMSNKQEEIAFLSIDKPLMQNTDVLAMINGLTDKNTVY